MSPYLDFKIEIGRVPIDGEGRDFVQFLIGKARRLQAMPASDDWTARSIDAAMRGMEDEGPEYSEADLLRS